jgi:hypothetical protein
MSSREAGGIGDYGEHFGAEDLVSSPGQDGGVDTSGIGD